MKKRKKDIRLKVNLSFDELLKKLADPLPISQKKKKIVFKKSLL